MSQRITKSVTGLYPFIIHLFPLAHSQTYSRQVQDLVRQLGHLESNSRSVVDLFSVQALQLRHQIRETCLRILLTDFEENGRKAEDTIWRKVFHSVVVRFKNLGEAPTPLTTRLMECHFLTAVGFYCNLIRLIADKGLDVSLISELSVSKGHRIDDEELRRKLRQIVHRCLTYTGDSYRYLDDLATGGAKTNAIHWYSKAILWEPVHGIPFNQVFGPPSV